MCNLCAGYIKMIKLGILQSMKNGNFKFSDDNILRYLLNTRFPERQISRSTVGRISKNYIGYSFKKITTVKYPRKNKNIWNK